MSTLKTNRIENLTTTAGGISIDNSGNVEIGTGVDLNTDGSATFTGTVQSGGNPNDGGAVGTKMTSTGVVQATRSSGASAVFMGYTQGTTTPTARINGDGAATFAGDVQAGGSPAGGTPTQVGTLLDPAGALIVSRASGDVFLGKKQNTAGATSSITADGDAYFLGNVGIGTSSPTSKLHVIGNEIRFSNSSNASYYGTITHDAATTGANIYNSVDGTTVSHIWQNSGNERMRITSAGAFKSSTDGTYQNSSSTSHEFCQSNASVYALRIEHSGTTPSGILIDYSAVTQNDTGSSFIQGEDATTFRFRFASNGGLYNYSANDSNLCDEREKKNIETLDSTWSCLKNWELKKFHYNQDADTDDKRYGVIAQQVEQHCPEVISDWIKQSAAEAVLDDDGNVVTPAREEILRKGVKEQQMMWMAIKALQEAQDRIETLEAEVAALKSN